MAEADRAKWDERYRAGDAPTEASAIVVGLDGALPRRGRALDAGGGAGRHAIWLAQRGLDVTVADGSTEGLRLAEARATRVGASIATALVDFDEAPPPPGPWDLVLCFHFLHRGLLASMPTLLAPGGVLVVVQPTRKNLERHEHPRARFLLDDGELPRLVAPLAITRYDEGWLAEGRHEAIVVACRR
jgi:SAM-dependent methyltransferase